MRISEILNKLQSTTKRNEKTAILESLKGGPDEDLFKRVAWLTYEPTVNFWVKDVDFSEQKEVNNLFEQLDIEVCLEKSLDVLQNNIAERVVTGNAAHDLIIKTYHGLPDEEKGTFKSVIHRDLKVGVSKKTLNKVWPDLIYDHPYMRASSFSVKNLKRIVFPCFSQTKEDGEYEDIIINDQIDIRSRSGAKNNHHASTGLLWALRNNINIDITLQGEVLVFEDATRQKIMPRQKGNGYLNSNDVDPERLLHVFWDAVPYKDFKEGVCKTPYTERFDMLKRIVGALRQDTDQVNIIDSRIVNSVDEIIDHFKKNVEAGKEGVLVKNTDMQWKDGDSKDQVKVKVEFECELKIVGFNQGKILGEWADIVGSIISESVEGKLLTNVGTGITDELREEMYRNQSSYIGSIITVRSNDVIANELKPDKMSLFLARLIKFRPDKTEADTYDRIIEQKEAFIYTLKAIED
jgi:DNA ligase-1